MPTRPKTRCSDRNCREIATHKGKCDQHQRKAWANPSKHSQEMDRNEQKRLKAALMAIDPTCGACGEDDPTLLQLDHITEIADGGAKNDPSNVWLLCEPCHDAKTEHARRARRARRKRANE